MLKSIIVAGAMVLATSAFAQNVQGAGSSGAAPQINTGMDKPADAKAKGAMSNDKGAMSTDKPAAGQGTTTGSNGSKAGTSTAK